MVAAVNRGAEIMREAICRYPKHRRPRDMSTSSDPPSAFMDVCSFLGQATQSQSTTSPWRRNYHSDLILIQYDTQHNCGHEVANRRGAFLICGVDIAEVGPDNNDKVIELIETISDHIPLPSATWRSTNICSGPTFGVLRHYVNEGYQSIADGVCGGILDLMPIKGIPNSFIENGNMSTPASLETCVMVL